MCGNDHCFLQVATPFPLGCNFTYHHWPHVASVISDSPPHSSLPGHLCHLTSSSFRHTSVNPLPWPRHHPPDRQTPYYNFVSLRKYSKNFQVLGLWRASTSISTATEDLSSPSTSTSMGTWNCVLKYEHEYMYLDPSLVMKFIRRWW